MAILKRTGFLLNFKHRSNADRKISTTNQYLGLSTKTYAHQFLKFNEVCHNEIRHICPSDANSDSTCSPFHIFAINTAALICTTITPPIATTTINSQHIYAQARLNQHHLLVATKRDVAHCCCCHKSEEKHKFNAHNFGHILQLRVCVCRNRRW